MDQLTTTPATSSAKFVAKQVLKGTATAFAAQVLAFGTLVAVGVVVNKVQERNAAKS